MASSPLIIASRVCSLERIVGSWLAYLALSNSKARFTSAGLTDPFQKSSRYKTGVFFAGRTIASNPSPSFPALFAFLAKSRQEMYSPRFPPSTIARKMVVQRRVFPEPGTPEIINHGVPPEMTAFTYFRAISRALCCQCSGVSHPSQVQPSNISGGSPLFCIAASAVRIVWQRHGLEKTSPLSLTVMKYPRFLHSGQS